MMTNADKPNAKVLFRVANEDGSAEVETLWATALGNDRYRLDNSPFYAYGVSWEDVVLAPYDAQEQFPTFQRVLEKSGNRTIRILFDEAVEPGNESEKILQDLVSLGCSYEGANRRYISLNIPPEVDLKAIIAFAIDNALTWEHADPTYDEVHAQ